MLIRISLVAAALLVAQQAEPAKTYKDPTYKYSITYPADFFFDMKEGKEGWFIFRHKRGTVEMNPNINVTREEIADDAGVKTTADYAKAGLERLKKDQPEATIVQEPVETKVDGKDFHKMISAITMNKRRFLIVQYTYYSPKFKCAFVWTALDLTSSSLKDLAALEEIIRTIKFE